MLNLAALATMSPDSVLPLFPSVMGGMNATKMRLSLHHQNMLEGILNTKAERLNELLEQNDPASEHQAEDLEEYCTYLYALVQTHNGARGVPLTRVYDKWNAFRSAYMDLFLQPPHLTMPYLDAKIQELHNLLVLLENEIQNPNLDLDNQELEHELALIKANHTRVYLVECVLKDLNLANALRQMVECEDRLDQTRYNHTFPDYCQARLMSSNQYRQSERNLVVRD